MVPVANTIYKPEWISEAAVISWLGCDRSYLFRLRDAGTLNYSKLGQKTMYDKKEIDRYLNDHSTYPITQPQLKLVV